MSKLKNLLHDLPLRHSLWLTLILRFGIVMLLFTLCRIGFYLFNLDYFPDMKLSTLLYILLGGLRFDLTAALYTNLLFILLMIIPFKFRFKPAYQTVVKWVFFVFNAVALAMNVSDFVYFRFTGRRTTADVFQQFQNEQNLGLLWLRFLWDYWYALFVWIALVALMVWLYKKTTLRGPAVRNNVVFYVSGHVMMLAVSYMFVMGVRGGFRHSTRPITLSDAGKYVHDAKDVGLVLNTPFAIYRTLGKTKIKRVKYFASEEELDSVFSPVRHGSDTGQMKKLNVVVLVLESFSKEFIGFYNRHREDGTYKGYTPFLDSLLAHSRSYNYSFASGRKSIDALPSVIASIPSMGIPYVLSPFSGNKINSLGSLLAREGYHTSFFHGAPNGSMGFDSFMHIAGIANYYGMTEYNNDADFDGWWGIWDEKFLGFMAETQKDFPEPFFSAFFSLSSHHPFNVPKEHEWRFKGGPEPILRCIQYTDYALKQYFARISKYPWFKNTIFVITADHVSSNMLFEDAPTARGLFSIPIFFYRPDNSLAGFEDKIIHQADVMPTVLSYLHYPHDYIAFGSDAFDPAGERFAWNYKDDVFQFYEADYLLQFDGRRSIALYNFRKDLFLKKNLLKEQADTVKALERRLKAIIQQYNNRMVGNNLTLKK